MQLFFPNTSDLDNIWRDTYLHGSKLFQKNCSRDDLRKLLRNPAWRLAAYRPPRLYIPHSHSTILNHFPIFGVILSSLVAAAVSSSLSSHLLRVCVSHVPPTSLHILSIYIIGTSSPSPICFISTKLCLSASFQ